MLTGHDRDRDMQKWENHHVDCDFRNSTIDAETAEIFGLEEDRQIYDCNLGCEE